MGFGLEEDGVIFWGLQKSCFMIGYLIRES